MRRRSGGTRCRAKPCRALLAHEGAVERRAGTPRPLGCKQPEVVAKNPLEPRSG